jgi:aryl-alcohol dehydrogenase-like predicted oxidoreductase
MSLEGIATTDGTARYRDRFRGVAAEGHFRFEQLLWLSSIGTGTYLGGWDDATDRSYSEAITLALSLGANVIDTAANYRFQRSERTIGETLTNLIGAGRYAREEIVVCTKGGYVAFDGAPPAGQAGVRDYIERTFVATGIARFEDFVGLSHCMTPRYLEHQVTQSLRNLKLEALDVYYVHNPESQLSAVTRDEFYARLSAAFEQLERERATNRIKNYGVATWNGFRLDPSEQGFHSLERMCEIARGIGGDDHGFRFVQLPFSLAMPEALTLDNQPYKGKRVSLLEAAKALGVSVVASASLMQGRAARDLPEQVREPLGSLATDVQTAIQFVRSTPGITTALVGMSRPTHVEENLQLVRLPPASADDYSRLFVVDEE